MKVQPTTSTLINPSMACVCVWQILQLRDVHTVALVPAQEYLLDPASAATNTLDTLEWRKKHGKRAVRFHPSEASGAQHRNRKKPNLSPPPRKVKVCISDHKNMSVEDEKSS